MIILPGLDSLVMACQHHTALAVAITTQQYISKIQQVIQREVFRWMVCLLFGQRLVRGGCRLCGLKRGVSF